MLPLECIKSIYFDTALLSHGVSPEKTPDAAGLMEAGLGSTAHADATCTRLVRTSLLKQYTYNNSVKLYLPPEGGKPTLAEGYMIQHASTTSRNVLSLVLFVSLCPGDKPDRSFFKVPCISSFPAGPARPKWTLKRSLVLLWLLMRVSESLCVWTECRDYCRRGFSRVPGIQTWGFMRCYVRLYGLPTTSQNPFELTLIACQLLLRQSPIG